MNLIAIAKVAFEAGAIEDPTQLTEDAISLDGYYNWDTSARWHSNP